jgi:2-polyprenyl-3-methyl-5-hydroxy-6-metoxy-1,4-benzoquinol methylase
MKAEYIGAGVVAAACKVCRSIDTALEVATERMNNTREAFSYTTCRACGSSCLADPMPNLQDYYAAGYYSGSDLRPGLRFRAINLALGLLVRWRLLSPALAARWPQTAVYAFLVKYRVPRSARILDVGSGVGRLVYRLVDMGYRNASGVDPFVTETRIHDNGAQVRKATIESVSERYDVIFFNHSLEHTLAPKAVLSEARKRLEPGGLLVVRIPLAASLAKEMFGEHWVQWDPPRHVTLFSERGFTSAAKESGLEVIDVTFDSTDFQFSGSVENVFKSHWDAPESEALARRARPVFAGWAKALNQRRMGDQAMFVMRAASVAPTTAPR